MSHVFCMYAQDIIVFTSPRTGLFSEMITQPKEERHCTCRIKKIKKAGKSVPRHESSMVCTDPWSWAVRIQVCPPVAFCPVSKIDLSAGSEEFDLSMAC